MLPVSSTFTAAEAADIAQVACGIYVYRGNYASAAAFGSSTVSSGDDASGNYPAAGAIDGDRTEINIGAASVSDNGIGLSSWKSATTPTGGAPVWLEVDFNATRTLNYVKLYNLAADSLTDYALQYWNGSAWVTFAGTSGRSVTPGYTGGLDIYDLQANASDIGPAGSTITTTKIRVLIYGTQNTDPAQIVEIEAYYKVDVTSRCTSIRTDRQRDWKQQSPMAAGATLVFDNSDRFFSPSHAPTTAETAAGFFNAELTTGLLVQVRLGFYASGTPYYSLGYGQGGYGTGSPYGGASSGPVANPETVNAFVGTVDDLEVSSLRGICTITARDGMKDVLNQTWSTRLKRNIDIGAAIQYMLNICNVSNYEMSIDATGLILQNFFVYNASAYTTVQQLVQAAGKAQFWFDENGKAQFRNLLASSSSSHFDLIWTNANYGGFSETLQTNGGSYANTGAAITITSSGSASAQTSASVASSEVYGWQFTTSSFGPESIILFADQSNGGTYNFGKGYGITYWQSSPNMISLRRYDSSLTQAGSTVLASGTVSNFAGTYTVIRDGTGTFYVYQNSVLVLTATDTTYSSFGYFTIITTGTSGNITVSNVAFLNSNLTPALSAGTLTVSSATIDQGATISAEGQLSVGFAPSNAPITWQTRTSADGVAWGAWTGITLNASTQQGSIASAAARYIQYRYSFAVNSSAPLWAVYYATVSWSLTAAAGTIRSLSYTATICEVRQKLSDSLGGDASIINYYEVQSAPLLLSGANSDVKWTAQTGNPVANVSASNPLVVYTGTLTIQAVISGGMDTSLMSGTNPAAVAITWGTATGSVTISYIHPTKPIITLTITGQGTITNLQLLGQGLSGTSPINVSAGDAPSQSRYKRRTTSITNNFIPNAAIAQLIANTQLALTKSPAQVLGGVDLTLTPSIQLTDQVQLTDYLLDLSSGQTWNTSGISHDLTVSGGRSAIARTQIKAVQLQ